MKKLKIYALIVITSLMLAGCAQSESALVGAINQSTSQVIDTGSQNIGERFNQDSS